MTIYFTHDALDSVPELSRPWDGAMEALLVTSGWLGHLGPGKLVLVHGIPGTEPQVLVREVTCSWSCKQAGIQSRDGDCLKDQRYPELPPRALAVVPVSEMSHRWG